MGLLDCRLIHLPITSRERLLDQNLPDINLSWNAVIVAALIVVILQVLLGNLCLGEQPGVVDDYVLKLTLFGNRIDIRLLVAIVIGPKFSIGWLDRL